MKNPHETLWLKQLGIPTTQVTNSRYVFAIEPAPVENVPATIENTEQEEEL